MRIRQQARDILLYTVLSLAVALGTGTLGYTIWQGSLILQRRQAQAEAESLLAAAKAWVQENRQTLLEAPANTCLDPVLEVADVPEASCLVVVLEKEDGRTKLFVRTESGVSPLIITRKAFVTLDPASEVRVVNEF